MFLNVWTFSLRTKFVSAEPAEVVFARVAEHRLLVVLPPYLHNTLAMGTSSSLVLVSNAALGSRLLAGLALVPALVAEDAELVSHTTLSLLRLVSRIITYGYMLATLFVWAPLHSGIFVCTESSLNLLVSLHDLVGKHYGLDLVVNWPFAIRTGGSFMNIKVFFAFT